MEVLTQIADKIGFDWRIAISHTINLGIIFSLLVKFALPKVKQIVNERTEKIKQGLKNKEESEGVLASAKLESDKIIKSAQKEKKDVLSKTDEMIKLNLEKVRIEESEIIAKAKGLEKNAEKLGFDSGINLLENKIGNILNIISDKAFSGKVNTSVESNFIKQVFDTAYAKK